MWRKIISKRGFIISLTAAIVIGCIVHFRDPCNNPLNDDYYCRIKAVWEMPSDASDIFFESGSGYWSGRTLRFKASSNGLPNFTRHFCDGVLHPGYDPYRAFNYGGRLGGQRFHLIKDTVHGFSYYSYSPNTPDTVRGNRCQGELLSQIRVEQVEPDLYDIRVDQGRHLWQNNCNLIPCRYIDDNFIEPIPDIPFVVMGLDIDSSKNFVLVSNELCLEYMFADYHFASFAAPYSAPPFAYLHDAKLDWTIDHQSQGIRFISARHGRLIRNANAPETDYYEKLDYCAMQNWTQGRHQMALTILTTSGERNTYTWEFMVE